MDVDKDLRPISLTPVLSKCIESYVRDWMLEIVRDSFDPHQFGCLKGSSTIHALVELTHLWTTALETHGQAIRILFLDFRKAFNRVDHRTLMHKLESAGLPPFIRGWIGSFLSDRKQRVKIEGTSSEWADVKAGVPQGTLLGPICFLVHIDDFKTCINDCKYVDDSTLWERCSFDGSDSDLQQAADEADQWCDTNKMQINYTKTKEMVIYYGKKPLQFIRIY